MKNRDIDVGIITVIPTEIAVLFNVLNIDKRDRLEISSKLPYWHSHIYNRYRDDSLDVITTFITGESGNTEAAITTCNFLRDWNPKIMCLVGIAAGIIGKIKIGDVVIPTKVHDRTTKVYKDGEFKVRGSTYNRADVINNMIKLNFDKTNFENEINLLLQNQIEVAGHMASNLELGSNEFTNHLCIEDGSISSDNILIRDSQYFDGIINETDEKCRGGEMEAVGFARACEAYSYRMPWLIIRGISDFGDSRKDDTFQHLAALAACHTLKNLLSSTFNLKEVPDNPKSSIRHDQISYNLITQFENAFKSGRWEEVCRIGVVLSRPLWLSGQHELRISNGAKLEKAAGIAKRPKVQASALIDDLGWTTFVLSKDPAAEKYINDGIRIAREVKDNYLLAKSHRHLAAINRQKGELKEARQLLEESKSYTRDIDNEFQKAELENSLLISEGKLSIKEGNSKEAVVLFKEALERFIDNEDYEREVKVYYQLAKAIIENGDVEEAASYLKTGREKAFHLGRYDELKNNTMLLVKNNVISQDEKNKYIQELDNFAISIGKDSDIDGN